MIAACIWVHFLPRHINVVPDQLIFILYTVLHQCVHVTYIVFCIVFGKFFSHCQYDYNLLSLSNVSCAYVYNTESYQQS